MNDSITACHDLVFMCADTGTVVAVTYRGDERPVLERAVIFPASGRALWVDPALGGGSPAALAVRSRGSGGRYGLRLSARAVPVAAPDRPIDDGAATGPSVPVSIDIAFEQASGHLVLESGTAPGERVALARGAGSVAVGSVIHRVEGSAWSADGPGAPGDRRARAVFQDGSALFVTAASTGLAAALVHNSRIRAVTVHDFAVRSAGSERLGRTVSWAAGGPSPAGAAAEIRDPEQRVTALRPDPSTPGLPVWSCAPFVFVRSGVTGLGLVERRTRLTVAAPATEPALELPDPF
ncbi:hypothetical protein [Actinomadura sp. NTSP31]|uniref:hypothetical protein n=1 Tax=Actinomadura sp. NTSP31 TaxID=1735447 RepID=UPI0035C11AF8